MVIDFSNIRQQVVETLAHSISSKVGYYGDDSCASRVFRGLTITIKASYAYKEESRVCLKSKEVHISPNEEEIVKHAKEGMSFMPFLIEEGVSHTYGNLSKDNPYKGMLGFVPMLEGQPTFKIHEFDLGCDENFEVAWGEKTLKEVFDGSIKRYLTLDTGSDKPLFITLGYRVYLTSYISSGELTSGYVAFLDKTKGEIYGDADCFVYNPYSTIRDFYDVVDTPMDKVTPDLIQKAAKKKFHSCSVEGNEGNNFLMLNGGFHGRYKLN